MNYRHKIVDGLERLYCKTINVKMQEIFFTVVQFSLSILKIDKKKINLVQYNSSETFLFKIIKSQNHLSM